MTRFPKPFRSALPILVVALTQLAFNPAMAEPVFAVEIRPEMELLAGVLAHASWVEQRGPSGEGNEYYRALKEYLAPYKDHQAIKIAAQLTRRGFGYDAPPAFILHLGPLPDLGLNHEYSDYLVQRAGNRQALEDFRLALKDLAARSRFEDFLTQWQDDYAAWVEGAGGLDGEKIIGWLEDFFGTRAGEFHVILAPAMFPGGGYGATIKGADGRPIVYQVIREQGKSLAQPEFPTGSALEALAVHEWGHSFVNPALEQYSQQLTALDHLYQPVSDAMRKQAYGSVTTFMNEQVLRAVTSLATEQFQGKEAMEKEIAYHEARGFYLTRPVIEALREYQQERNRYPDFPSFVPELLDRLAKEGPPRGRLPSSFLVIGGASILAVLLVIIRAIPRWKRRRATA